ncbi:hypothetical protein G9A89_004810 [Geosiphon pyriformis]|nr:hypothetical protein G9A89_004810 [Geosiphon pyriformis]
MEEEFLIEETSVNYGERDVLVRMDSNQMPKSPRLITKQALGKSLGKINFLGNNDDNDILLDEPVVLSPPLKKLVNVSARKSFTLDINLINISEKSAQDKLAVVRKLFSKINSFGRAFTPSKFSGIIWVMFTSESSLMKATKLAANVKILVNTDLKKLTGCLNWAVVLKKIPVETSAEAVRTVLSEFGMIKSIKMQLVELWQKARCAIVCFESAESLDAIMEIISVLKGAHLCWFYLGFAMCTKYKKLGYTSLNCVSGEKFSSSGLPHQVLSDADKGRLVAIYAKCSAPVAHSVSFGGVLWAKIVGGSSFSPPSVCNVLVNAGSSLEMKPTLSIMSDLEIRFAVLESSIASLVEQIGKLTKKLDLFMLAVSQPSPGLDNIVMGEGLGGATSDNTAAISVSSASLKVKRLENMLEELSALWCAFQTSFSMTNFVWKIATCNVHKINNLTKQDDVIHWHKDMDNLIFIFTELKLKGKVHPWIANRFDGVRVFISGLNSDYLSAGVAVVINNSLTKHVCKVSEVPGWLISIRLLFRNKLSVSILGLYTGASSAVRFSQAGNVNFLIAKAVNDSSFIILGGDFNENGSCRCANYKKCFDLSLVNSLNGSFVVKASTWSNSYGVLKTIDYLFVSSNLVNAIVDHGVADVVDHFDTDHKAVSVSVDLGGLLDVCLISLRKQANKDHWKFDVKNADMSTVANAAMFSNEFFLANIICKIMVLLADEMFKKKWFKSFNGVFTKISSRFHKLELLVSKLVKASCSVSSNDFVSLLEVWDRLDFTGALAVKSLLLLGSNFDVICSILTKARKLYHFSKLLESKCTEESSIKQAINKRIKSFELDKGHTIKSVLEHSFCKVVLDHLVVGNELILEPNLVKPKTKKCRMVSDVSNNWVCQYQSLDYVFDSAFSGVMCPIGFDEMSAIVKELPNGKAAGLSVLDMLLVLLNFCLVGELVPEPWREAWVLMIPKPYKWEEVLMNTHSIALIETAHKIFFKIFLDKISSACSTFDVLCGDNFSVLKDMTTQSPIFAIGSVIKDALEKNWKLWLVLQDMHKAYDLVGWEHLRRSLVRIKMCNKFIRFFGSIHNKHINRVMTDFGLTNGYYVHNRLDQGEVFSPFFWYIFYDLFLYPQAGLTLFFATSTFVNNMIWFFRFNNISINNDKTVAISINCWIANPYLTISGSPISIAKKEECHHYLGIFLLTEELSRPSLVKVYLDVWFFANLVLKKVVSDKQFVYLVSAVLFLIVCYRMQFNAMICKGLKSKTGFLLDFPNNALHYLSLYGLRTFEQIQTESKSASVVSFVNSVGLLGHLFSHRFHDLQVLSWHPHHLLQFPVHIKVCPTNNFLAEVVRILSRCDLSLGGSFPSAFCFRGGFSMSFVLGEHCFFKYVSSLCHYSVAFIEQLCDWASAIFSWNTFKCWKRLDPHGPIPFWFDLSVQFLSSVVSFSSVCLLFVDSHALFDVLQSHDFGVVCNALLNTNAAVSLFVYTNRSLSSLGTISMKAGAAAFFEDIYLGLGVRVSGIVFLSLVELQAIALALECILPFHLVDLFSDSQVGLDACESESSLICPDFRNWCWIERHHIANVIWNKNLNVNWVKIKDHSSVSGNEQADALAKVAAFSSWWLPHRISEHFLRGGGSVVFGNLRHFVCNVFQSVNQMHWEIGSGSWVVVGGLHSDIDWSRSFLVWHPNSYMAAGFTSAQMAGL